jgi:hypothetical protein
MSPFEVYLWWLLGCFTLWATYRVARYCLCLGRIAYRIHRNPDQANNILKEEGTRNANS